MKNSLGLILFFLLTFPLTAQENAIEVFSTKTADGFEYFAKNNTAVPYTIRLTFTEMKNLTASVGGKTFDRVVPAYSDRHKLLELHRKDPNKSTSVDFSFSFTLGNSNVKAEKDFPYLLPFKHGKRVKVGQGNNGTGTHQGINAIDFNLDIGDTIYAARSGIVTDVKEDSNKGGYDPKYEPFGNYIKIYHEDGTLGSYVHLKKNGSLVKKGDQVKTGEIIGLSGNTGWSSGPHLHFMVSQNQDFKSVTLPIKFLNYDDELFLPQESKSYYGYHPGKPAFEVETKEKFDEAMYEAEIKSSNLKGTIQFDEEKYDDYILIYVNNGIDKEISGTLSVELNNLISTKSLPYQFTVPANKRMYLLALYPKENISTYGYKLSGKFK